MPRAARLFRRNTLEEKLYHVWFNMKDRCKNKDHPAYARYGGRGIKVCSEWYNDFLVFLTWAKEGYEEGLWLDRKDNNGDYVPNNCRWITPAESRDNVKGTIQITAFGETKTVSDWSKDPRCRVRHDTLARRIKYGSCNPETAITLPAGAL